MPSRVDPSSKAGSRALERLERDIVAWLISVTPTGQPQSSVIWFLWKDDALLIYSRPDKPKVRNIAGNPHVAFTLNSDERGNDMLTLEGVATIDETYPSADQIPEYVEKYREPIAGLRMTPQSFAEAYSVPILISPQRARYW